MLWVFIVLISVGRNHFVQASEPSPIHEDMRAIKFLGEAIQLPVVVFDHHFDVIESVLKANEAKIMELNRNIAGCQQENSNSCLLALQMKLEDIKLSFADDLARLQQQDGLSLQESRLARCLVCVNRFFKKVSHAFDVYVLNFEWNISVNKVVPTTPLIPAGQNQSGAAGEIAAGDNASTSTNTTTTMSQQTTSSTSSQMTSAGSAGVSTATTAQRF